MRVVTREARKFQGLNTDVIWRCDDCGEVVEEWAEFMAYRICLPYLTAAAAMLKGEG